MKIVIAMDSFKGSLTSTEAGSAAAEGIRRVCPDAEIVVRPLADGGEGTVAALTVGGGEGTVATLTADGGTGRIRRVTVTGPLGEPVEAEYGIVTKSNGSGQSDEQLAVIESSAACGLPLVSADKRNPMHTTTYGLGQMILDAASQGCRRFLIGIGGSATNDAGAGMLQALGYRLLDAEGRDIAPGAAGLGTLAKIELPGGQSADASGVLPPNLAIDTTNGLPLLQNCTIRVACDVTNPLCGPLGASAVFGPQKGATEADIPAMDEALRRYAEKVRTINPDADPDAPGSGAAGGLGYTLRALLGAELVPGSQLVIDETALATYMDGADLIITGEGRLDDQTAMGKAPAAVAALARARGIPAIALAGSVEADAPTLRQMGLTAWYGINDRAACDLATAMQPDVARRNMAEMAARAIKELVNRL